MSRRIAVFALAAGTALMIGPVEADQECFDSTCMQPAAIETPVEAARTPGEVPQLQDEIAHAPPATVRQPAEISRVPVDAVTSPDDVAAAQAAAGGAPTTGSIKEPRRDPARNASKEPARELAKETSKSVPSDNASLKELPPEPSQALPRDLPVEHAARDLPADLARMPVVETPRAPVIARKLPPAPHIYPRSTPEPVPARAAQSAPPRPPVPAPRYAVERDIAPPAVQETPDNQAREAADAPVRVVNAHTRHRTEQAAAPVVVQAQAYAPVTRRGGSPNVVVVAPPVAEDGTIAAYPVARPDPNWKLCQIDQRTGRHTYCTASSYHPYGEGGYRPMGTYRAYATAPGYVTTQPDARIISLDQGD